MAKTKKRILAGPWIGEFGPEVALFAPRIRFMARRMPQARIVVAARPSSEFLYRDFADRFIGLDLGSWDLRGQKDLSIPSTSVDASAWWRSYGFKEKPHSPPVWRLQKLGNQGKILPKPLGEANSDSRLLVHCRNIQGRNQNKRRRNGNENLLERMLSEFDGEKVASIGHPEASTHVKGTEDLRGLPLEQLADVLASAKIMIGPDSGVTHLAHHCACPTIHWGDLFPQNRGPWIPAEIPIWDLGKSTVAEQVWSRFTQIIEEVKCTVLTAAD